MTLRGSVDSPEHTRPTGQVRIEQGRRALERASKDSGRTDIVQRAMAAAQLIQQQIVLLILVKVIEELGMDILMR